MNILKKANEIVNERSEEKERQYGPFVESMKRATAIYNSISPDTEQISVSGMYRAMIALKLSREVYSHKEDNLLDAVAYMGSMNDYLEGHTIELNDDNTVNEECRRLKEYKTCEGCEYYIPNVLCPGKAISNE